MRYTGRHVKQTNSLEGLFMVSHQVSSQNQALILIAAGFCEQSVVQCLSQMREAGLAVSLIGLSAGLIRSLHGVVILPDYSLEQLSPVGSPRLVIVPGSKQSVSALLADPRVHKLLHDTLEHGGFVAATTAAQIVLAEASIANSGTEANFLRQEGLEMGEYVKQLIYRMIRDR